MHQVNLNIRLRTHRYYSAVGSEPVKACGLVGLFKIGACDRVTRTVSPLHPLPDQRAEFVQRIHVYTSTQT
jgi:hypothetical protein